MQKTSRLVLALLLAATLSACATRAGQNTYNASDVGRETEVHFGRIIAMREVTIKDDPSGLGTGAGLVGGGVAGSAFGHGGGNIATTIAGAVLGGLAGAAADESLSKRKGVEYTIAERSGKVVTVVQNVNPGETPLKVGQRVMVQTSRKNERLSYDRVLPADNLPAKVKRPEGVDVEN